MRREGKLETSCEPVAGVIPPRCVRFMRLLNGGDVMICDQLDSEEMKNLRSSTRRNHPEKDPHAEGRRDSVMKLLLGE